MTTQNPVATKRAWKLQEFVAHGANVNCLALGHKSGRVLVTGGDDKKVNLWAIGKPNCIMSLCGHTTPVECVRFGHTEELVCAGSQSGALKIWDLEAARLVRTLTGHKAGLTCVDFHPYGDFLSSGSTDTNLKLWDIRRKGCIFTYKGHSERVNSLKFSPDGQWIASAGEEGAVKIWDLRAGKLMTEFQDHSGPVHEVEFHPHEFLLASASRDRTVNFWDLESFSLVSTSERDSGPVRCITFHPESECLFSASPDSFKVHLWEPHRICDNIPIGWGKIRDIAIASTQLIGAAFQMSNVSIYVVDLKKVQPMGTFPTSLGNPTTTSSGGSISLNPTFKAGQHVRRSFVRDRREKSQMKISEDATSDSKSEEEESDSIVGSNPASGVGLPGSNSNVVDIADYTSYEHIFRPRRRELNRTPTKDDDQGYDTPEPPFEAPNMSGSESESNIASVARNQLRVVRPQKKPSPSPTRRSSQPSMHPETNSLSRTNNRMRRTSNTSSGPRPMSFYDNGTPASFPNIGNIGGSPSRQQRASSVQPRSAVEIDNRNGGDVSPPVQDNPNFGQMRAHSLSRGPASASHQSPNRNDFSPLTPVSRIQIGGGIPGNNGMFTEKPLDRPTLVRPTTRSSMQQLNNTSSMSDFDRAYSMAAQEQNYQPHPYQMTQSQVEPNTPPIEFVARAQRASQADLQNMRHFETANVGMFGKVASQPNFDHPLQTPVPLPKEDKIEIVPMNSDKPCGLEAGDFLPKKFQGLTLDAHKSESRFSTYKGYNQSGEMSEGEVVSSILKGHESMMAVLTTRGRNIEILHKLWQNKDAKAAVDQAVSLNDQAVLVDFLSVITLRPSIWNLDLCTALLPPLGELLQSKYELYITTGCAAMKVILKNFASVIKSNIDSPVQTVGVDISREERHNKCMQCYKDLVKIRSLIIKRQSMQGKMGHTYRELAILMQYLD